MDCPRCVHPLPRAVAECPHCGFSLAEAVFVFGAGMLQLSRLVDSAHCLRLREVRQIDSLLDDFQRRFPQVFLTIYLGVLPNHVTVRQLSFWLLNRAAFEAPDQRRLNEYGISFVLDPVAKCAGLTVGYSLETVLPPPMLEKLLKGLRTALWHGEYSAAIRRCIAQLDNRLRKAGRRYPKANDVLPPQNCEEFLDDSGWNWLRKPASDRNSPDHPLLNQDDDDDLGPQ